MLIMLLLLFALIQRVLKYLQITGVKCINCHVVPLCTVCAYWC